MALGSGMAVFGSLGVVVAGLGGASSFFTTSFMGSGFTPGAKSPNFLIFSSHQDIHCTRPASRSASFCPSVKQFLASLYLPRWKEATPDLKKAFAAIGDVSLVALDISIAISASFFARSNLSDLIYA